MILPSQRQQKLFGSADNRHLFYHNIKKLLLVPRWQDYLKAWVATLVDTLCYGNSQ
jgi:hypothetical protein